MPRAHPDSTAGDDARWDCVDIRALAPLARPVTLDDCKADPRLAGMVLVKNSRLSVQPVTPEEWQVICALGGVDAWASRRPQEAGRPADHRIVSAPRKDGAGPLLDIGARLRGRAALGIRQHRRQPRRLGGRDHAASTPK